MKTSNKFRQASISNFLNLNQIRAKRRFTLANSIDSIHSELIIWVSCEVWCCEVKISNIVVIETIPRASGFSSLNDVTGNLWTTIKDGKWPFKVNISFSNFCSIGSSRRTWRISLSLEFKGARWHGGSWISSSISCLDLELISIASDQSWHSVGLWLDKWSMSSNPCGFWGFSIFNFVSLDFTSSIRIRTIPL